MIEIYAKLDKLFMKALKNEIKERNIMALNWF